MVGSAGDINFSFLVRWLLRHVTRRVILVLICIASITMPFLLLRMKSKTSVEATRQYSVLHEEVKDNIINAYRNDDYEERSRYMVRRKLGKMCIRGRGLLVFLLFARLQSNLFRVFVKSFAVA